MRVSEQMLRDGVERMCRIANREYRLECAYGGWKVTRKHDHGGYEDVFQIGYVPKKTLWYSIDAYLRGHSDALLRR